MIIYSDIPAPLNSLRTGMLILNLFEYKVDAYRLADMKSAACID